MVELQKKKYSPWILERVAIGDIIRLPWGITEVGRKSRCSIRLLSTFSSRTHCKFEVGKDGRITVQDFSSNGTFVNSHQYRNEIVYLSDGDRIGIGCEASDEECETGIYYVYILKKKPMYRNDNLRSDNKPKNDSSNQSMSKENLSANVQSPTLDSGHEQPCTSDVQSHQECKVSSNHDVTCKIGSTEEPSLSKKKSVEDITNGPDIKVDRGSEGALTKGDNMASDSKKNLEDGKVSLPIRRKSQAGSKKSCDKDSEEQNDKPPKARRKSQVEHTKSFERDSDVNKSMERNDKPSIARKKSQVEHNKSCENISEAYKSIERNDKEPIVTRKSHVEHKKSFQKDSETNKSMERSDDKSIARRKSQVEHKKSSERISNGMKSTERNDDLSYLENYKLENEKKNTNIKDERECTNPVQLKNRTRKSNGEITATRNSEQSDGIGCSKKLSTDSMCPKPPVNLNKVATELCGKDSDAESPAEISKNETAIESSGKQNIFENENQNCKSALMKIFDLGNSIKDNKISLKTEDVEVTKVKINTKTDNKISDQVTNDEVLLISDDEEEEANLDFELSQRLINDIKQEFLDLELEESFGPPKMKEDNEYEGKLMSPIIEIEDDEDDFDDSVSQWAMKLSQSTFKEFRPKSDTKETRKIPEIISPPSLPTRKGKLRGVSAQSPSKKLILGKIEHRTRSLRQKDKFFAKEQELKQSWLQKPSLQRRNEREEKKKIQEERKQKLKELAEHEQAHKRKLDDDDDVKIVKKPKVKVTVKNRGAFLTENMNVEKTSAPTTTAPITRAQLMRIPKLTRNTSKESDANRRQSISAMETTSNENESNDAIEGRDTLIELKIKHRKARVSSGAAGITNEIQKTSEAPEVRNNFQIQNVLKSPRTSFDSFQQASTSKDISAGNSSQLKSIIKVAGLVKKNKKTVRFNDVPKVIYIEVQNESGKCVDKKDAAIDLSIFIPKKKKEMPPRIDYSDKILSEILSWSPSWLETRTQEVNNLGHVLLPLLHKFSSFEDFSRILFPLMKLEFWASIEQDFFYKSSSPYIPLRVESFKSEKRGIYDRFVYYCDYTPTSLKDVIPLSPGDLCSLKIETAFKSVCIFAFVEFIKKINLTQKTYYQLTIQSNINIHCKELIELQKTIKVRSLSQIRVDLGAFNAVYQLKHSPLLKIVLDPNCLLNGQEPLVETTRYKGCDELNENQKKILLKTYLKCVDTNESNICLIEGPPGTGKSRLITNLALQILYGDEVRHLDKKILICSQSNTAIDVIVLKLLKIRSKMRSRKFRLARFGILERMHPKARCVSVQSLIENYLRPKEHGIHDTLKQERMILEAKITALNHVNANGANNISHDELQKLKQRLEMINRIQNQQVTVEMEKHLYYERIQGAHIVCTTLSSCIKLLQYTNYFDVCIIDEATQCLEPWTLIPLQFGISSLVLVGDTQQLPGTVLSKTAEEYGLGESLFTRIQKCLEMEERNPILSLRTQYRMHPEICKWPNSYFYKNQLLNDQSTSDFQILLQPYIVFDLDYGQDNNVGNGQISNSLEAKFVSDLILHMSTILPTKEYAYGVITPYAQHRESLNVKLREAGIKDVLVNTIDSYQGKEKDVIIMSNARTKGIGFLNNCQRLNVAMTRARKCLILCGNFSNLLSVPVWKSLLDDAKQRGVFYHIKRSEALDFEKNVMRHLKV